METSTGKTFLPISSILNNPGKYKDSIINFVNLHDKPQFEDNEKCKLYADRAFLSGWCSNQSMYHHREKIETINKIDISKDDPSGIIDYKEWFPCNPSICPRYIKGDESNKDNTKDNESNNIKGDESNKDNTKDNESNNIKGDKSNNTKGDNGYFILLRLVNFSSQRANNYVSHSKDGKFSTRNLLLTTDENFKILKWIEVIDKSNRKIYPKHVQGLEDMQIFQIKEKNKKQKHKRLGFVCTLVDCQPTGIPLIGFGLININTGQISKIKFLWPLAKDNCEKNWLPWWSDGKVNLLYHGNNMLRLGFKLDEFSSDSEGINWMVLGHGSPRKELRDVRGSAGPIPFDLDRDKDKDSSEDSKNGDEDINKNEEDRGFLFLFHEVIWINNGRTYIHRFVLTNKSFNVIKIGHYFCFEKSDIEFARSMTWKLNNKSILICVGIEDHASYIYEVNPKVIKDMLVF